MLNITKNLKEESWSGAVKLHDSIVRASVTYLAHITCIRPDCLEQLESSRLYFSNRLISLPFCTPGYDIGRELNLDHTAVSILTATINWIIKILELPAHRLSSICLHKLVTQNSIPFTQPC